MKKILKTLFIIIFIAVILVPVFTMPLWGEDTSAEKRELSSMPSIITEDNKLNPNYTSELSTYLSEHFSFRSKLVTAWSLIQAKIFRTSTQDKVIVGKNDWLYFADTLPDYSGTNVFTNYELKSAEKVLDLINEYVESKNGDFVFVIVPNKNTLYPENMPYYIAKSTKETNYEKLSKALSDNDYYLNILPTLQSSDKQLYHKRDSHWNNLGAQICFSAIMDKLNKKHIDYSKVNFHIEKNWRGDLDDMIFPTLNILDKQIVYEKENTFEYVSSFHSPEDLKITTYCENGQGKLFMVRDSFTNALQPFFSEEFMDAHFSRILPCRLSDRDAEGFDTVILELVERNLPELLKGAPVMEAPVREAISNAKYIDCSTYSKNSLNMINVYGLIPESENLRDLYIEVSDGNTKTCYEAFPVIEEYKLQKDNGIESTDGYYGFSAYLPYSSANGLEIKILTNGD